MLIPSINYAGDCNKEHPLLQDTAVGIARPGERVIAGG